MREPITTASFFMRLTTIRLQRRHLRRDAGIQHWMQASLPGWRPSIFREMLAGRTGASTVGCGFVGDAAVQADRDRAVVAGLPGPSACGPPTAPRTRAEAP